MTRWSICCSSGFLSITLHICPSNNFPNIALKTAECISNIFQGSLWRLSFAANPTLLRRLKFFHLCYKINYGIRASRKGHCKRMSTHIYFHRWTFHRKRIWVPIQLFSTVMGCYVKSNSTSLKSRMKQSLSLKAISIFSFCFLHLKLQKWKVLLKIIRFIPA